MIPVAEVVNRYRAFYADRRPGGLLVKTDFPYSGSEPMPQVTYADHDLATWEGARAYCDIRIAQTVLQAEDHAGVDDDSLPELFLHIGTGVCGACFDECRVEFTAPTSWSIPSLTDWSRLPDLDPDRDAFWAGRLKEMCAYIREHCRDRFAICPGMHMTPLDGANALRGNALFTDVYEYPEELRQLLDYCTRVLIRLGRELAEIGGSVEGGQSIWGSWMPGVHALSLMEDTSNLCSPDTYRRFGREYTQRALDGCGGGFIHNHILGRHQFPAIASLRGLSFIQASNDPKHPRTLATMSELLAEIGDGAPLMLEGTAQEVYDNIGQAAGGRVLFWVACDSREEARRVVEFLRSHSRPARTPCSEGP